MTASLPPPMWLLSWRMDTDFFSALSITGSLMRRWIDAACSQITALMNYRRLERI